MTTTVNTKLVTKRDGTTQAFDINKIQKRVDALLEDLATEYMDVPAIIKKTANYAHSDIKTTEVNELLAETAAYMNQLHPDCGRLAARICVTQLQKQTSAKFSDCVETLYTYVDNGENASLIAQDVYEIVQQHKELFDNAIVDKRDWDYDFFGYKTLERAYLLKVHGKVVERPQYMMMRVAIGIHKTDVATAIETYNMMSQKYYTHATPTLFNAGTKKPQMSSCFLLAMQDDSIQGIYQTLLQTALISKSAGGIGLSVHNIRAQGTYIKGTNGISNGLLPMLKVFNETARYVDQGGGKRKGSFAIYLEPWHADIFEFLQLKKNHGKEEQRARDLFYALWTPDLFMKRVKENGDWTLFCPNKAPGLHECHGAAFEKLYLQYEAEGRGNQTIKAQKLWEQIITSQIETGTPYMLYKDHANGKSNQQNLGTIKSSNLCCEIMEYTSKDEVAVCNLASLCLPKFINEDGTYNFEKLHDVTRKVTKNLNRVIDVNYYPIKEAENSNMRHRPIGIGIQGMADTLIRMKIAFEDEKATQMNAEIFETIYHAAMTESCELAKKEGHYQSFKGSPLSQGKFQFDLWNQAPATSRYDWDALRKDVMEFGARNSLLVAPMPTASTAQICSNNESFEPYTSNLYTRRVLSGEYICGNPHLVRDCIKLGIWNAETRNRLVADQGSVQNIPNLPQEYKNIYKTIWEISQKQLIKLARARAPYICQSQSMNIYFAEPSLAKLSASHIFAWEQGLKTGQYYLRSRPAKDAIQFTLDNDALEDKKVTKNLSKADMDKKRRDERHAKKRTATVNVEDVDKEAKVTATNLNKKQRTSVESPVKDADKKEEKTAAAEKPWEGKEEKEDDQDYRWNICENCQ